MLYMRVIARKTLSDYWDKVPSTEQALKTWFAEARDADWSAAGLTANSSPASFVTFAEKLRISPAIPAGQIRYETGDYTILSPLVGNGKERSLFNIR